MKNTFQTHPGSIFREDVLEVHNLNQAQAAEMLGVTKSTISDLCNGKNRMTANMAVRIAKVFGGTPDIWLKLQNRYDIVEATSNIKREEEKGIKLTKFA